jgi:hypothetical protein
MINVLTPGSTVTLNENVEHRTEGPVFFQLTPAQACTINAVPDGLPGQEYVLNIVTSGVTSYGVTFGTGFATNPIVNTGNVSGQNIALRFISTGVVLIPAGGGAAYANGVMFTKLVTFTENATNTIHTGTVTLPAGAYLHGIQVNNSVLWGAAAAVMKVGDTADDDGYFVGVDLKATDLLVGEVLDTTPSTSWGGKEGAYLVAATGRRGPTSSNFGKYYAAGSNITGIITVTTPAVAVGRTQMVVIYSLGEVIAAIPTGP